MITYDANIVWFEKSESGPLIPHSQNLKHASRTKIFNTACDALKNDKLDNVSLIIKRPNS